MITTQQLQLLKEGNKNAFEALYRGYNARIYNFVLSMVSNAGVAKDITQDIFLHNLTIEEAAAYSGIGVRKLYDMTGSEECPFVLWIGSRRLIKRKVFDEYIAKMYSV